jgi:glycosyltransferase involved in cell wall biosynthesis
MKLNIGILGSRGIPNQYGGFEQFAEYLSIGLLNKGHKVSVYSSHQHTYQNKVWNGVQILHCYDPEHKIGTMGQFIYDLNCLRDARKRNFDVLLILGYTSSSVWHFLFPRNSIIITNMDGLEWKRTKFKKSVQNFLKFAEKLAVRHSDYLIADSIGIQDYLQQKYNKTSQFIPYGAVIETSFSENILESYNVKKEAYFMLMARMEPENNVEVILDGFHQSSSDFKFLVVGNPGNKFGTYLVNKYKTDTRIIFCGAIYNQSHVHNLRHFSYLYFHGHSVGGTNPSLLEAMASASLIAAHDNPFNKTVLKDNAYYFGTATDVLEIIKANVRNQSYTIYTDNNLRLIEQQYSWEKIINDYEEFMINSHKKTK